MSPSVLLLFVAGVVLLLVGAELLVRGASRLAVAVGLSPLVVGLTVVAFGTSSPELAVSVHGALVGQPDVALGNVIGSNVINVLVILGLTALVAPIAVAPRLLRVDVPLMIGASVAVLLMGLDGHLGWADGTILLAGAVGYTAFVVQRARRERGILAAEYEGEYGLHGDRPSLGVQGLLIVAGLGLLVLGSRWLVDGAVALAHHLGLSELVISITIVALGTSLPELATSLVASLRGERDIAVGNVIGSNLFNLLVVLGAAALVAPGGIPVGAQSLHLDLPVMIAVAVGCLPVFFTRHAIDRWEGALFLAYFGAYTTYIFLRATGSAVLPAFDLVMLGAVVPLTALVFVVLVIRHLQRESHSHA